jgi:hypothetical protein
MSSDVGKWDVSSDFPSKSLLFAFIKTVSVLHVVLQPEDVEWERLRK